MGKRKVMEKAQQAAEGEQEQQQPQHKEQESDHNDEEHEGTSSQGGSEDSSSEEDDSAPEVSDDQEDEDSPDEDPFDQINVDFQFFDPKESDFHGLKALLHTYLDGQQYDSSPLVDTIIAQASVGTVVRTGEDEDPIAVMTVLNTQQHKQAGFMSQIRQYVLGKCKDAVVQGKLAKAWDAAGTGLIINERLVNSPPQLAPPLVQALFDEVGWATEDAPQDVRDLYRFKQYLLVTRVYSDPLAGQPPAAAAAGPSSGKPPAGPKGKQQQQQAKKQKGEQPQQQSGAPVIVFVRPEDEFFHQQAAAAFTFPVEGRAVGKDELQPLRLVMLLPADKVPVARKALDAVVGNMAAQ
ncbi:p21-C-terminal region-binding protein-domain-containing protein [Scenedesmus sp. NREL 46B-D3]|nr:p21-C-terminal region-binding protein-domain-containing protein [Scenedesmus sp. NREL 46B-D3]